MSSARKAILDRVDKYAVHSKEQEIDEQAKNLLSDSVHATLAAKDSVEAFVNRIKQGKVVGTTCSIVKEITDLPASVAHYLNESGLGNSLYIQNTDYFAEIDWAKKGLENLGSSIDGQQDGVTALTMADYGIAETGSLVFHSGHQAPVLLNFLCAQQIIVVFSNDILRLMDDYAVKTDARHPARNTIWITGASGTTDIEGVLVQGAHGPAKLHIFIVAEAAKLRSNT